MRRDTVPLTLSRSPGRTEFEPAAARNRPQMITVETRKNLVNIAVLGEFTLADYKEFESNVLYGIKFHGAVDLLVDLRDMAGFTVDVAWEDLKFSREHKFDFDRIAVVVGEQWIKWSTWLQRLFVDADLRTFSDYEAALAWITSD